MKTAAVAAGALTMMVAAHARAQTIEVREQPHAVSEATIVVDAPSAEVYAIVTDYARWPQIFSDDRTVTVEAGGREDARVRFKSKILEHEVTVQFENVPDRLIRFKGIKGPPGGRASGTYRLEAVDGGQRTRISASLYLDVVGLPGAFVRDSKLRNMRQAKLRADLADVARAAAARARAAR